MADKILVRSKIFFFGGKKVSFIVFVVFSFGDMFTVHIAFLTKVLQKMISFSKINFLWTFLFAFTKLFRKNFPLKFCVFHFHFIHFIWRTFKRLLFLITQWNGRYVTILMKRNECAITFSLNLFRFHVFFVYFNIFCWIHKFTFFLL